MPALSGKEVRKLFGAEKWKQGREYWQSGLVKDLVQARGSWQGKVLDLSGHYQVRIRLAGKTLTTDCSCTETGDPCRHAAAVLWGWLVAPGRFLTTDWLIAKLEALSRQEAIALLRQVAEEEGALLHRLLRGQERVSRQLTGAGLLSLVYNLGFNQGSPWVNWRLFAERYQAALKLIVLKMQEQRAEGQAALETILQQLLELLAKASEVKSLLLPLFFQTFAQCISPFNTKMDTVMLKKILAVYLQVPLDATEEERFGQLINQLLAKGLIGQDTLRSFLSSGEQGETEDLKKLRLQGLILLGSGKQVEFEQLITACDRQLAPFLTLIDLLEQQAKYEEAKVVIKANLVKFTTAADRYILRYRLAQLYRKLGELRPALFLEVLNYTERPGKNEYFQIKELAMAVGEWNAVRKRLVEHKYPE